MTNFPEVHTSPPPPDPLESRAGTGVPITQSAVFTRPLRRRTSLAFWLAVGWTFLILLVAALADLLPLFPYDRIVPKLGPAAWPRLGAELAGTDAIGRSVLSRLVYGARESVVVGLSATVIALMAGLILGVLAGYFRGWVDRVISVVLDSFLSIPPLILLLAVAAVGQRGVTTIAIGLGVVGAPGFARLARAGTLALAGRDYVRAARVLGARRSRIIVREIVPTVLLQLSPFGFVYLGFVFVAEGSLSFLGLGVPPPSPSWGGMINDGRAQMADHPLLVFLPAACLFLTVAAATVVGDEVRRRFDLKESALR
jgi:peptide/nickel transport system permease protein